MVDSKKRKCIRINIDRVKMVVGLDVGLSKVEGLMDMTLVGIFMGTCFAKENLKLWMKCGT